MKNNKSLKRKIIYRATHRGSKEMDLLLGNFVKDNINKLDLENLESLVLTDDETLKEIYYKKNESLDINKIFKVFKEYKL